MVFSTFKDTKHFTASELTEYLEEKYGIEITQLKKREDLYSYPRPGDLIIAQKLALFDAFQLHTKGIHIAVLNFRKNITRCDSITEAMSDHVISRIRIDKGSEVKEIYRYIESSSHSDQTS